MRVKICGITSTADALLVEEAGADALGLIMAEGSSRQLTVETAQEIAAAPGPFIARVGVFRNQPLDFVLDAAVRLRLDLVQLHGDESADYMAAVRERFRVLRAVAWTPGLSVASLEAVQADAVLLDAPQPGSGKTFDWEAAAAIQGLPGLVLAGGLNPGNVKEAIERFRPAAVDVASGVESAPGIKSPDLVRQFVAAARSVKPVSTGRSLL